MYFSGKNVDWNFMVDISEPNNLSEENRLLKEIFWDKQPIKNVMRRKNDIKKN